MTERRQSWKDVRDNVHGSILDGTYAPGDRLPRDRDIAEAMNCARSTVQRAMQELADAGIVERRRRGGTRVRPDPVTRATFDIPITRLEVEARGGTYGYQLIGQQSELPPPHIAATMRLDGPAPLLRVQALHLSDNRPYLFEDRWIVPETVPEIGQIDLRRHSANEWLVRNKPYDACDLRFYAQKADGDTASIMSAEPGAALLVIERTTWVSQKPITTVKSVTAPGYQMVTQS